MYTTSKVKFLMVVMLLFGSSIYLIFVMSHQNPHQILHQIISNNWTVEQQLDTGREEQQNLIVIQGLVDLYIKKNTKKFNLFNMVESPLPMKEVSENFYKKIKHMHSMTLLVRMPGSVKKFITAFYCDVLRSIVLFWNPNFGKLVVVLDKESTQDHTFGAILLKQAESLKQKVEVKYTPLPRNSRILTGKTKSAEYNRQMWDSFFLDLHTEDDIIAWMDSDSMIGTPVTSYDILKDGKIKAIGQHRMLISWVGSWAKTTELALGLPMPSDFMLFFPVFLWRSTITNCRNFILKRFHTQDFEEAFSKFYPKGVYISPIDILMTYAWHFERDKYDWHLDVNGNFEGMNQKLPNDAKIKKKDILPEHATGYHTGYYVDPDAMKRGYCLSHYVSGKMLEGCKPFYNTSGVSLYNLGIETSNGFCNNNQTQKYCSLLLARHYRYVQEEYMKSRSNPLDLTLVQKVENMANNAGYACIEHHKKCVDIFGKC